ncbi:MAG: P-II family nitrogen regulator [Methanomassiliicoccales archaeon]|nr:P-II family nitrogen regulator [Methanomassiliicoccales archaeon]
MQLIRAIVRPECEAKIVDELDGMGLGAMTKISGFGQGRQKAKAEAPVEWDMPLTKYDVVPKTMLMIVADDDDTQMIVSTIMKAARTGGEGDGKIFVTSINEVYTVRTGAAGI